MACPTGLPICSARSAFWFPRLIVFLLLIPFLSAPQNVSPADVHDCRPCSFSVGTGLPLYSFTFVLKTVGGERRVAAIDVNQDSKSIQRLRVTGMEPVGTDEDFFFGGTDINFDGFLDLMLMVRRGVANSYAEYWLFDPKLGAFTALGTYPVFRVDAHMRRLSTYERGGDAGLIHESKEYAFENGKLTLVRDEKQDSTAQPGNYRKVVSERIRGVMRIVKTEVVRAPQ